MLNEFQKKVMRQSPIWWCQYSPMNMSEFLVTVSEIHGKDTADTLNSLLNARYIEVTPTTLIPVMTGNVQSLGHLKITLKGEEALVQKSAN